MSQQTKKIAIITSGGDCQAMNAAIRAVVIAAHKMNIKTIGITDGYYGMTYKRPGDYREMTPATVEDIVRRGGTILNSARFDDFRDPEVVKRAAANLREEGISALVVIGGDGSFRGSRDLLNIGGIPCIGIPATIDNDIVSTEYTLGFNSALRYTVDMCDALRNTCNSHKRCNVVEVMGRKSGQIALYTAIAVGASCVFVPELPEKYDMEPVIDRMIEARRNGKRSFLAIFAEGAEKPALDAEAKKKAADAAIADYEAGKIDAAALSKRLSAEYNTCMSEIFVKRLEEKSREAFKKYYAETGNNDFKGEYIETKFVRPAHIVRGGRPTCRDRVMAGKMGYEAVKLIADGKFNRVICVQNDRVTSMDLNEAIEVDSIYRKFCKTGEDKEILATLTEQQRKMYDYRLSVSRELYDTAASLFEV